MEFAHPRGGHGWPPPVLKIEINARSFACAYNFAVRRGPRIAFVRDMRLIRALSGISVRSVTAVPWWDSRPLKHSCFTDDIVGQRRI